MITIVNPLSVSGSEIDAAISAWDEYEKYFSNQEGHVSSKLLKAHDMSGQFSLVTISVWDKKENFEIAVANPEHRHLSSRLPQFTRYPATYETIRDV